MRSNKNHATRFLIRRNLFIGVIVFLIAFYMMPFWALSHIPQVKTEVAQIYAPEDLAGIAQRFGPLVSSNVMTTQLNLELMVILYGGLGFLTAMMLMRHQFSRRQSMLHAALPDKRETDFLRRCVGYIVLCLVPIVLNFILYLLIVAANGMLGYVAWGTLLPKFALLLLINLYGFAVGMLASVLTGTYWAALLAGAVLIVGMEAFAALWYWLGCRYLHTLIKASFTDALLHLSPSYSLYKGFYKPETFVCLPGIAAILLALVLSFMLYRIRKTEKAERTLAFDALHGVMGFVLALMGGTFLGIVVKLSFETELSLVIGMALGALLTFWVCRMVFNQRLCGMLRQWYLPAAATAVLALGVFVLHIDALGYDRFLPDREQLTAITYRPQNFKSDEIITLSDSEALDAAYAWCTLMQEEVSGYDDGLIEDGGAFVGSDVVVTYQMGDRKVQRHYPNSTMRTEAQDSLRAIIESDDYRQSLIREYGLNGGDIRHLYLNSGGTMTGGDDFYERFGVYVAFRGLDQEEDGPKMEMWLGALKADILSRTFEEKQQEAIFTVDLSIKDPDTGKISYKNVDIHPGDTRFLNAVFGGLADEIVDYATGGYVGSEDMIVFKVDMGKIRRELNESGTSHRDSVQTAALAASPQEAMRWIRDSQNTSADLYYYKPYIEDEPYKRLYIYQMSKVEKYSGVYDYEVPQDLTQMVMNPEIPITLTLDYVGEE